MQQGQFDQAKITAAKPFGGGNTQPAHFDGHGVPLFTVPAVFGFNRGP